MNLETTIPTKPKADPAAHKALDWLSVGMSSICVLMILGVLGGVGLVAQTDDSRYGGGSHPYIGTGLAAILASILGGLVVLAVFNFMVWRVKSESNR
jgi:hypothetical protein